MRIHLHHFDEAARDSLAARLGPGCSIDAGELADPARIEVLVSGRPDAEVLDACRSLRRVIVPWSGIPPRTRELVRARPGLTLHNLHHNSRMVAEMALCLLLAAARRVIPCDAGLREGRWLRGAASMPQLTLDGKHALILGGGAIGSRVAVLCAGIGMQVRVIRRRPGAGAPGGTDASGGPEQLDEWLAWADALLVCLPLTERTAGLIGARELALMPPGGLLVNVSRGEIVEEEALHAALQSGQLFGAGIDTWYSYPGMSGEPAFPSSLPFHELDQVVLSPHRAGAPGETGLEERRLEELARLLAAEWNGESMPNRVDLVEGY